MNAPHNFMEGRRFFFVEMLVLVAAAGFVVVVLAIRGRRRDHPLWRDVCVRRSKLKGAGDGLFALRPFKEGDKICDYRGQVLSLRKALEAENRDYIMCLGLNCHVDASNAFDVPGRYVNDNFDTTHLNAEFRKQKHLFKATLVATKSINVGDEIYASYGQAYWRPRGTQ